MNLFSSISVVFSNKINQLTTCNGCSGTGGSKSWCQTGSIFGKWIYWSQRDCWQVEVVSSSAGWRRWRLPVTQVAGSGRQDCVGWQKSGRLGGDRWRSWSTGKVATIIWHGAEGRSGYKSRCWLHPMRSSSNATPSLTKHLWNTKHRNTPAPSLQESILAGNTTNCHGLAQNMKALQRDVNMTRTYLTCIRDFVEVSAQSPQVNKRHLPPQPVHPAAAWQTIQKYLLSYHQTTELLCSDSNFRMNNKSV